MKVHRTLDDGSTIEKVKSGLYHVRFNGHIIGTIEARDGEDGGKWWYAWLLGYKNYTWIGTGRLETIAESLIDHERDQRHRDYRDCGDCQPRHIRRPSRMFRQLIDAGNPDYRFPELQNTIPFKVGVEMIGRCAGRVYLREEKRMVVATMSDTQLAELRNMIDAALNGDVPEGI